MSWSGSSFSAGVLMIESLSKERCVGVSGISATGPTGSLGKKLICSENDLQKRAQNHIM